LNRKDFSKSAKHVLKIPYPHPPGNAIDIQLNVHRIVKLCPITGVMEGNDTQKAGTRLINIAHSQAHSFLAATP
jgi:hypothetical protein